MPSRRGVPGDTRASASRSSSFAPRCRLTMAEFYGAGSAVPTGPGERLGQRAHAQQVDAVDLGRRVRDDRPAITEPGRLVEPASGVDDLAHLTPESDLADDDQV